MVCQGCLHPDKVARKPALGNPVIHFCLKMSPYFHFYMELWPKYENKINWQFPTTSCGLLNKWRASSCLVSHTEKVRQGWNLLKYVPSSNCYKVENLILFYSFFLFFLFFFFLTFSACHKTSSLNIFLVLLLCFFSEVTTDKKYFERSTQTCSLAQIN